MRISPPVVPKKGRSVVLIGPPAVLLLDIYHGVSRFNPGHTENN